VFHIGAVKHEDGNVFITDFSQVLVSKTGTILETVRKILEERGCVERGELRRLVYAEVGGGHSTRVLLNRALRRLERKGRVYSSGHLVCFIDEELSTLVEALSETVGRERVEELKRRGRLLLQLIRSDKLYALETWVKMEGNTLEVYIDNPLELALALAVLYLLLEANCKEGLPGGDTSSGSDTSCRLELGKTWCDYKVRVYTSVVALRDVMKMRVERLGPLQYRVAGPEVVGPGHSLYVVKFSGRCRDRRGEVRDAYFIPWSALAHEELKLAIVLRFVKIAKIPTSFPQRA